MNFRLIGSCVVCLLIGGGVGYWLAPRRANPAPVGEAVPPGPLQMIAESTERIRPPIGFPPSPEIRFEEDLPPEVQDRIRAMMRLDALCWLKHNGQEFLSIGVSFNSAKGEIDPAFFRAFGISVADARRLNESLASATARMSSALVSVANATVGPDNKTAVVELPAIPEVGGALREETLSVMREVLGPDRWPFFEELSLDSFNRALGGFGSIESRVEIGLADIPSFLEVKTYHVTQNGSSWSESKVDWDGLERMSPVVAAVLPESFRRELQGR